MSLCGGNVWGMKKDGESFIAYFSGRRSRVRDFIQMMKDSDPTFVKESENVKVHETAAPSDMKWWEEKPDYEARKLVEKEAAKSALLKTANAPIVVLPKRIIPLQY